MFEQKLTEELKEKLKNCKTAEELKALFADAGLTLSDEELNAVAGGEEWSCLKNDPDCQKDLKWY